MVFLCKDDVKSLQNVLFIMLTLLLLYSDQIFLFFFSLSERWLSCWIFALVVDFMLIRRYFFARTNVKIIILAIITVFDQICFGKAVWLSIGDSPEFRFYEEVFICKNNVESLANIILEMLAIRRLPLGNKFDRIIFLIVQEFILIRTV